MEKASQSVRSSWCAALSILSVLGACEEPPVEASLEAAEQLAPAAAPQIESVSLSGPGCGAQGTYRVGITGTRDSFRIRFDEFALTSRSADLSVSAECKVSVVLAGTHGVAYAPAGMAIEVRGNVERGSVTTVGHWAADPEHVGSATTTFGRGGVTTGALDEPTLWSSCSGTRELRFTTKIGIEDARGTASVRRLSDLRFYARPCREGDAGVATDAATEPSDGGIADAAVDAGSTPRPDAQVAVPDAGAAGSRVTITSVTTGGLGCRKGTVPARILEGGDDVEMEFPDFAVASAPNTDRGSTDCTVNLKLAVPTGKTVALEQVTLTGAASLPADATTRISTYANWVGSDASPEKQTILTGPREGSFEVDATFAGADLRFRRCQAGDATLSINFDVSYRTPQAGAAFRASVSKVGKVRFVTRDCE